MSPNCSNNGLSLNDRRPRFLRDMIGNEPVQARLGVQMRNGRVPSRTFLYGPSGVGKTTLAEILARRFHCDSPDESGEACGACESCRLPEISSHPDCQIFSGEELNRQWDSWIRGTGSYLWNPSFSFFIDEVQDLEKRHQKALFNRLESAKAMVIFATTHKHEVEDALVNRFGANVYELRRPTPQQAVNFMMRLCGELGVQATTDQLMEVTDCYMCDLRKCVDFVHTAAEQTADGVVSDDYMTSVFGLTRASCDEQDVAVTRGPKF